MLRAMDSAVAGLRAHQNKLDVIGNNIANVNTFGFKSQTYSFKDTMYQTSSASSGGKKNNENLGTVGGANPAQYGYGALTGSIATDYTSSTPSYVGGFNASINGSGFFITNSVNLDSESRAVEISSADTARTTQNLKTNDFSYTRVGQFTIDANGYMVDTNGSFVYGFRPNDLVEPTMYGGDADTKTLHALRAPSAEDINAIAVGQQNAPGFSGAAAQLKSVEIGNDGVIKATVDKDGVATSIIIGKVAIASFQNQEGLMKAGNNTFNAASGDNTGIVTATEPGGATPTLMAGYLEASNVDLAKEFSDMITTQRGFQANSKIITVSDEILQELVNMKR